MCDKDRAIVPMDKLVELSRSNQATADQLRGIVERLGACLIQLDARMRRQEELMQRKVTISHDQQKKLMACIRKRAEEVSERYHLPMGAAKDVRAAIRKDVMRRRGICDLHDLPETMLAEITEMVWTWESYTAIRAIRKKLEDK